MGVRSRRLCVHWTVALSILGWASPSLAAEGPRFWAKADTQAKVMQADLDSCTVEAKDVHARTTTAPTYYGGGGLGGAIGAAIGAAIVSSVAEHGARAGYIRRCMYGHGYSHVPMTGEEASAFRVLKTPEEKVAWSQSVYDKPDFGERLNAVAASLVAQLPPAKSEPLVYSGIRFDPMVLTPASGVVAKGATVLSGPVLHRQTARLREDFSFHDHIVTISAAQGTVLFEEVFADQYGEDQTYWCGELTWKTFVAKTTNHVCIYSYEDGYDGQLMGGNAWYSAPWGASPPEVRAAGANLVLEAGDTDLVGPMDFDLNVSKLSKTTVAFEAKLKRDGRTVKAWSASIPFDDSGRAVLPFWSHRLTVTRSNDGVTVAFTPDGDGKGWEDIPTG